jgi:hypothetical protein
MVVLILDFRFKFDLLHLVQFHHLVEVGAGFEGLVLLLVKITKTIFFFFVTAAQQDMSVGSCQVSSSLGLTL